MLCFIKKFLRMKFAAVCPFPWLTNGILFLSYPVSLQSYLGMNSPLNLWWVFCVCPISLLLLLLLILLPVLLWLLLRVLQGFERKNRWIVSGISVTVCLSKWKLPCVCVCVQWTDTTVLWNLNYTRVQLIRIEVSVVDVRGKWSHVN